LYPYAFLRGLLVLIVGLLAVGVVALAGPGPENRSSGLKRQKKDDKPGKKRVEEEDETTPPPVKKKKHVEDEDDKPAKRKVVRADEPEEPPARTVIDARDLAKAARETRHIYTKALFAKLAVPHDTVSLRTFAGVTVAGGNKGGGGTFLVRPLPVFVTDVKELKDRLTLKIIDEAGKDVKTEQVSPRLVVSLRYYEQIAMAEVKEYLSQPFEKFDRDDSKRFLGRFDQLVAGEQALSAVMRFHQSAREREVRKGDAWKPVENELHKQLLGVLLDQLKNLAEHRAWNQAFALTRRLAETYTRAEDHALIAKPLADLLKNALKDSSYNQDGMKEARQRLRQLEDRFPGSKVIEPIRESLREQARVLFERAKALIKDKREAEAQPLLAQAEETWPELPGLRALRIANLATWQILRVNMRELPRYLSPGYATTDAEHRGVDLLFESLVNLLPDDRGVLSYRPSLSIGRPKVVPLGRQFKLPRNARWSDGAALTATDLRFTVDLLQKGQGTGRCAAWGSLLKEARVPGDPYRVKLVMQQGFLDPLGLMSFKVLPQRTRPNPKSEAFALKPITSGPFRLDGERSEKARTYTSFQANPAYGVRGDKLGLPHLKEVRFFALADPVKEMKDRNGDLDLALDLTAEQAAELQKETHLVVPLPSAATPNRRIYFLAVNHRHAALANADLRLALGRAIPREQLLDDHFRKGLGRKVHRAINGPYPARSWACNPTLVSRQDKTSLDPYDPDLARTKLKQALAKLGSRQVPLTVKYPAGDKVLQEAVAALCEKVNKTLPGVRLSPEERSPHKLREDIEQTHSYELAYYWYDFPDESFWLFPLLGPSGPAGSENYLGYNGALVSTIQLAMTLRHFGEVRKIAHAIHSQLLDREMPFVPLWQLDPLYAYRKGRLTAPPLDPNRVFAQAESWRVGAAGRGVGEE
jgi:ABC-type transport system substrate-binding protein